MRSLERQSEQDHRANPDDALQISLTTLDDKTHGQRPRQEKKMANMRLVTENIGSFCILVAQLNGGGLVRSEKLCAIGGESPPSLAATLPGFGTKELNGKV